MLEPIEPSKQSSEAETIVDLEDLLLYDNNLCSLVVSGEALQNISLLIKILIKNKDCLKILVLDNANNQPNKKEGLGLANAINSCTKLNVLAIENFRSDFGDDIEHLAGCLEFLPELEELSFNNTFLWLYFKKLELPLITSTSLKKLDITNTALVNDGIWSNLTTALYHNKHLEELRLGSTSIWHGPTIYLSSSIPALTNQLKVLDWTPLPFVENEELYFELFEGINWDKVPGRTDSIEYGRQRLRSYRESGQHNGILQYQRACSELKELQEFLTERNHPTPQPELVLEYANEFTFNLHIIASKIFSQRLYLRELTIRCQAIERYELNFSAGAFDDFLEALKSCTQLQILRIENLQGSFTDSQITLLITQLRSFSSLHALSFKKTYIGIVGVDYLGELLKKNILTNLDLTLSGLISDNCYFSLSRAINFNISLKVLNLGRSPMTIIWLKYLAKVIQRHSNFLPLSIEWESSNQLEMNAKMHAMCSDLNKRTQRNLTPQMNYLLKRFYQQEPVDLALEWTTLKSPHSTYKKLTAKFMPNGPTPKEMEMVVLPTEESSLNNVKKKMGYGTASPETKYDTKQPKMF